MRSKHRPILLAVAVGLLAVTAVWFLRGSRASEPPATAETRPAPRTLAATAPVPRLNPELIGAPDAGPPPAGGETGTGAIKSAIADCWTNKTCPAGSTCWMGDDGRLGCFTSNCSGGPDGIGQCGADRTCSVIDRKRGVRRCVTAGAVPEGGVCQLSEFARERLSCAPGLECWLSHCRRLCEPKTGCAKGACVRVNAAESVCVPPCTSDAECRVQGFACVAVAGGGRTCLRMATFPDAKTCRPDVTSCAPDERCDYAVAEDTLISACRPTCSDAAPCPGGGICVPGEQGNVCVSPCEPHGPRCPPRESCVPLDPAGSRFACRLVPYGDRPAVHTSRIQGNFNDPVAEPR
jgi:hypothetical protein